MVTAVFLCPAPPDRRPSHQRWKGPRHARHAHPRRRRPRPGGGDRRRSAVSCGTRPPRTVRVLGRPSGRPARSRRRWPARDLVVDASRGDAVADQPGARPRRRAPIASSSRRPAGTADRAASRRCSTDHGAAAVAAVELQPRRRAVRPARRGRGRRCSARSRRSIRTSSNGTAAAKRDRPSGTALDLAAPDRRRPSAPGDRRRPRGRLDPRRRLARDAPRRVRRRRRDRRAPPDRARPIAPTRPGSSPPPTGSTRAPREPGLHPFDPIVDELIARRPRSPPERTNR